MTEYLKKAARKIIFIILLIISCIPFGIAQDRGERPGIGLALSGGGAHGIAHLGVIKVMEEAGLRPDYISGVSMGSIIGGLYSIGYSADSLLSLLKNIEWENILSNRIQENKVIFQEKENFYNSILYLPLSKNKIILPSGLINGQLIENTLNFYAWPAADINDFSNLPIPFTCMATDIITYKKIELNTGYLPDAIRASFSVPSIFTPIKIDTLLLLDGGLIRNFAASEVKNMGADIVIGSYVGFNAYKEEELQSVSGIIKQIALFRSLEDFIDQEKFVDVLIKADVKDIPITGFENVDSLFMRGYKAALPYKKYFTRLSDSLNRISTPKPLRNILDKQTYIFERIEVTGNKHYSDLQILGVLNIEPEEHVDRDRLSEGIELLYGKGWFDKVKYRIVPRNDSLILNIDCIEKPEAMVYGSVHYDNALLSGLKIGLSVNNFLTQRSVININSLIARYYRFRFDFIQFIDANQAFGLSPNFSVENTLIPMMKEGDDRGGTISRNFIPGISFSKRIGLNNMMSLNINLENRYLIYDYNTNSQLKNKSYNYLFLAWDYQINTIDRKHYPEKGTIFNFSAGTSKLRSGSVKTTSTKVDYRDGDDQFFSDRFFTFRGDIRHYFSPDKRLTFAFGGEALWISDSDTASAQSNYYFLGGVESVSKRSIPMTGFHSNEIHVKSLAGFRSDLDIEIIKDLHINLMADIFAIEETKNNNGFSVITGFGLGAGYMSVIGPLRIGIMYGNYKKDDHFSDLKGFISIGYKF